MKKIILLFSFLLLFGNLIIAQMNYQFVMLDDNDDPVQNTVLGIQFKIRAGSSSGTIVYQETNDVLTDEYGRASVAIGTGTPVIGTYDAIDRTGKHFLDVEVDIDGGSNYQPFTSSEIFPAFKADEIDPDFVASPASSITQADIDNWNDDEGIITETDPVYSADPASSITQVDIDNWNNDEGITTETDPVYSADPASSITQADIDNWNAGGSVVVVVNQANHTNVSVSQNDIVQIEEEISITSDYDELDYYRLHISGQGFTGTGTETIEFGYRSTIKNCRFQNLKIDASDVVFINCRFDNVSSLGSSNVFIGGKINNCTLPQNTTGGYEFKNVEIDNSVIPRARIFSGCDIDDCELGNQDYSIDVIESCYRIENTLVYVKNFQNNRCEETTVRIDDGTIESVISGNTFLSEKSGEPYIMVINVSGTASYNQKVISNNVFYGGSGSTDHIRIFGTFSDDSTKNATIHLEGNTFTRGDDVISNGSSGVHIIFTNNVLNKFSSSEIGLSGSFSHVANNIFIN